MGARGKERIRNLMSKQLKDRKMITRTVQTLPKLEKEGLKGTFETTKESETKRVGTKKGALN